MAARSVERLKSAETAPKSRKKKCSVNISFGDGGFAGFNVAVDDGPLIGRSDLDYKRWADVKLCDDLCKDILSDLEAVYTQSEARTIYVISILRALEPDINDYEIGEVYNETFLSVLYPDLPISRDNVPQFIEELGCVRSKIDSFMELRMEDILKSHPILVDGVMKSDLITEYDKKSSEKDVAIVYSYDVESSEPVCCGFYPDSDVDIGLMMDFMEKHNLGRSVIVADNVIGFGLAKKTLKDYPDLHFLFALCNTTGCIEEYHLRNFDSVLKMDRGISCMKGVTREGLYLYSFQDTATIQEDESWRCGMDGGVKPVVFLSDVSMEPDTAYKMYGDKREMEDRFGSYGDLIIPADAGNSSDWSVIGTEFLNFLSVLVESRMRKAFSAADLKGMPYRNVLRKLRRASVVKDSSGGWGLRKSSDEELGFLVDVGVLEKKEKAKRKSRSKV